MVIQTENLSYHFRKGEQVLNQLSLNVPEGSVYGFLGPNGAGKTTTLRLILGLLKIESGEIKILGKQLSKNRLEILKKVGSLIEQPSLYGHLTGKENLELYRLTYGLPVHHINRVLDIAKLRDAAHKKAKAYSLGMKQRLSIAVALLHDPELLILDEPTNGLDPKGIVETRELIIELSRKHGKTIMVSSHMLSEIEKMATHVGIIHKGKLLFEDAMMKLQSFMSSKSFIQLDVDDAVRASNILQGAYKIEYIEGNSLYLQFESRGQTAVLNKKLVEAGIEVSQLYIQPNDLEKIFVELTA